MFSVGSKAEIFEQVIMKKKCFPYLFFASNVCANFQIKRKKTEESVKTLSACEHNGCTSGCFMFLYCHWIFLFKCEINVETELKRGMIENK